MPSPAQHRASAPSSRHLGGQGKQGKVAIPRRAGFEVIKYTFFFPCEELPGSAENRFTATRPLRRDPFPPSRAEARKWRRGPAGGRPLPQRLPGASQPRGPLSASRASEGEPRPVATPPFRLATPTPINTNAG